MKLLQQFADRIRPKPLAERGETGQIDENHRRILAYRLLEKVGIAGQPLLNVRRLKLFEQFASRGEILRPPPARPQLHRAKQNRRWRGRGERQRRAQPYAPRKRQHVRRRAISQRQQASRQGRSALRRHASKPTRIIGSTTAMMPSAKRTERIPQYPVSGHQMRDRRGNDFHPRHHRIERGREKIATAGDRRSDNDNSLPDGVGGNLAGKHRGRTDRSDGPARDRKKSAEARDRYRWLSDRSPITHAVWLDGGFLADRQRRDAQRKRHFDSVAAFETASGSSLGCRSGRSLR